MKLYSTINNLTSDTSSSQSQGDVPFDLHAEVFREVSIFNPLQTFFDNTIDCQNVDDTIEHNISQTSDLDMVQN